MIDSNLGGDGSRPGRRDAARERMLQAGFDAWAADLPVTPFETLEVRDVVAAAGRRNGAFYNLWPSVEAYRRDLLIWVLEPTRIGSNSFNADEAIREAARLIEESADPVPLIRMIAEAVLEGNMIEDRVRGVALVQYATLACAQGDRDGHVVARDALRRSYQGISDFYGPAYAEILRAWRRRLRPPWDITSGSMALTALVDGYVVQSLFNEPTLVGPDVFADALLGLITSITESEPGRADFDDWTRAELGAPLEGHIDLEDRVARAATSLYRASRHFETMTVATVAAAAGVSQRAVRETYGPEPWHLSIPIWQHHLIPQLESYAAQVRAEPRTDPISRLTAITHAIAEVASQDRSLTNAFLHVAHADRAEATPPARSASQALLRISSLELIEAYYADRLDPTTVATIDDAVDAAEMITINVVLRIATRRHDAREAAQLCLARLLPTMLVPT